MPCAPLNVQDSSLFSAPWRIRLFSARACICDLCTEVATPPRTGGSEIAPWTSRCVSAGSCTLVSRCPDETVRKTSRDDGLGMHSRNARAPRTCALLLPGIRDTPYPEGGTRATGSCAAACRHSALGGRSSRTRGDGSVSNFPDQSTSGSSSHGFAARIVASTRGLALP